MAIFSSRKHLHVCKFSGRRNNNFKGFRGGKIWQYGPNGRRINQQNQNYLGNKFWKYDTGQSNGFQRGIGGRGTDNRYI